MAEAAGQPISPLVFNRFLREEKLMGSRCKKCGTIYAPPRPICIKDFSTDMEWYPLKGKGKLATFTFIYICPPWMKAKGFDRNCPYVVGVVELEEGVKIDARIVGIEAVKPETLKVGMPVTVTFLHEGEGDKKESLLAFKLV